ncbi:MAG: polysaccharide pyruvyl transferase family protein [Prevotella sp.]|nr:polysaccharide pyruvyl transferase family protein [Prevotella sp.]
MKKYLMLSDFNIRSNNRGTAALGYGAIAFLLKYGYIDEDYELIRYRFYRNPLRNHPICDTIELDINGRKWKYHTITTWFFEKWLYKYKLLFINTLFRKTITDLKLVAALNGGDGLTDIYGERLLNSRLPEMNFATELNIPFIIMPQTIGPFHEDNNKQRILNILRKAIKIYVRDTNFVDELVKNNLPYEEKNDLSFYMQPLPFPIEIQKPCVGINVSGLAFSNKFGNLVGQFDAYPKLMTELVKLFQSKGCHVYIIPHSYNVNKPEKNNDDMEASKIFYDGLDNKTNVHFIDKDLISPKVKYLISQMDFFVGTRMHANYAAIFTNTPVFGLAYSYKFKGAFEKNGIYNRVCEINNLPEPDVEKVVFEIEKAYDEERTKNK